MDGPRGTTMLQGRQEAILKGLRMFEIHGQPYYDILFQLTGEQGEEGRSARVSAEAIYPDPKVGDRVMLHFLMNMVTQVERMAA